MPDNLPLAAFMPAFGGVAGAINADDTGSPIVDKIRGGLVGLGAGAGASMGYTAAEKYGPAGQLPAAAGGGILAWLAAARLLKSMRGYGLGEQKPFGGRRGGIDRLSYLLGKSPTIYGDPYQYTSAPRWNPDTTWWPASYDDIWLKSQPINTSWLGADDPLEALHRATRPRGYYKRSAAAKGIPDRKDYGDPTQLPVNKLVEFVRQRHDAHRAGKHTDIRLGDESGLHSWATKKELPGPGGKIQLFHQPVHSYDYRNFEGKIEKGYGAGTVKKEEGGKALVTKVTPEAIHFTLASRREPQRFALIKPAQKGGKGWLLINTTPTEPVTYDKVRYKSIPQEQVDPILESLAPGSSVTPKVDGAAMLAELANKHIEALSYRASSTGKPIVYTEKMFGGRPEYDIPKDLRGSVLRGELYGYNEKDQKVVPPQELGGLLNATLANSLKMQQDKNIKLKTMLFDLQQHGKERVSQTLPYEERIKRLKDIMDRLQLPKDQFQLVEQAKTPEEAKALWEKIRSGQHPLTNEGVVIHRPGQKPLKAKLTEEYDVHVTGTFPGEGKYKDVGAGGILYSHDPGGEAVGRVGTGLSDDLRRQLYEDPKAFIGRIARVKSQQKLPSGALRAPSLLSFHEDLPTKAPQVEAPVEKAANITMPETALLGLLSLLGTAGTLSLTNRKFNKDTSELPKMNPNRIKSLYRQMNLPEDLPTFKGQVPSAAYTLRGPDRLQKLVPELDIEDKDLMNKVKEHGSVVYNPKYLKDGIIAHEAGHASMHIGKPWYGPSKVNQHWISGTGNFLNMMLGNLAGGAAGLISKNPLVGAGVGSGIGLVTGLPTLINEYQATSKANKYMDKAKYPQAVRDKTKDALRNSWLSYLAGSVAQPTLFGAAAGGYGMLKDSYAPDPRYRILSQLIQAKKLSDVRMYKQKHMIMAELMKKSPDDFDVDSKEGTVVGVTHKPTRFKMHLPLDVLPVEVWDKHKQKFDPKPVNPVTPTQGIDNAQEIPEAVGGVA